MNQNADLPTPLRPSGSRLSRRESLKWVMTAVAASALPGRLVRGEPRVRPDGPAQTQASGGVGYGLDPDLLKTYKPGDLWPLTFNDDQRKTAAALADIILPEDKLGPAASAIGVVDFIDEWISAPYPRQKDDREPVLQCLSWIASESMKRFAKPFTNLDAEQHKAICDDICFEPTAKPEFKQPASCFDRFRDIAAGAYYATPEGWKAIGYVGNVPLEQFDGPPGEVLEKLGVTQTVQ